MRVFLLIALLSLVSCSESRAKQEERELPQATVAASVSGYKIRKYIDGETTCYTYRDGISCVRNR